MIFLLKKVVETYYQQKNWSLKEVAIYLDLAYKDAVFLARLMNYEPKTPKDVVYFNLRHKYYVMLDYYLSHESITLDQVAQVFGFNNSSNVHRAFKRLWDYNQSIAKDKGRVTENRARWYMLRFGSENYRQYLLDSFCFPVESQNCEKLRDLAEDQEVSCQQIGAFLLWKFLRDFSEEESIKIPTVAIQGCDKIVLPVTAIKADLFQFCQRSEQLQWILNYAIEKYE